MSWGIKHHILGLFTRREGGYHQMLLRMCRERPQEPNSRLRDLLGLTTSHILRPSRRSRLAIIPAIMLIARWQANLNMKGRR